LRFYFLILTKLFLCQNTNQILIIKIYNVLIPIIIISLKIINKILIIVPIYLINFTNKIIILNYFNQFLFDDKFINLNLVIFKIINTLNDQITIYF